MLTRLRDSFQSSRVGRAAIPFVAAFGIASMPMAANADNHCEPLYVSEQGLTRGASFSAHEFSTQEKGNVGIAIYAGQDLKKSGYSPDQIGAHLVRQIEKSEGIQAQCFVHYNEMPNGTSIMFKVNGINVPRQDNGVNLIAALDDNMITTVRGEATLVKFSQNDKQPENPMASALAANTR